MDSSPHAVELVLSGGGAKGPGLLGAIMAAEDRNVPISVVSGVSIGSIFAAFYTNGYSAREILEIIVNDPIKAKASDDFNSWFQQLSPLRLLKVGFLDLRREYARMVNEYELAPNENLRIIAYNLLKRTPVLFEGLDYNLAQAMAASCSIPGVMPPVNYTPKPWLRHRLASPQAKASMALPGLLVDGGLHHPSPSEFCAGPVVVFELREPTELPSEKATWLELLYHKLEMKFGHHIFTDPKVKGDERVRVNVTSPDVASVQFSLSPEKVEEMVQNGYDRAAQALDQAIGAGRLSASVEQVA